MENQYQKRARLIREADSFVSKSEDLYHEAQDCEAMHQVVNKTRKCVRYLLKSVDLYLAAGMGLAASYSFGTAAEVSRAIGDVEAAAEYDARGNAIDSYWEDEEVPQ